jgi:hypothetical protein
VTSRGARLTPRAIAVVEQVDAEFFAEVTRAEALRFLRRLVQLPKADSSGIADKKTGRAHGGTYSSRSGSTR